MKKIILIIAMIVMSILLVSLSTTNNSFVEKGYMVKRLGTSYSEARSSVCNDESSIPITKLNVMSNNKSDELVTDKIYELNDGGDLYYYRIISVNEPFSDRDSFFYNNFSLINVSCEVGYNLKYLGKNLAPQSALNSCNIKSYSVHRVNVLPNLPNNNLTFGKTYVLRDGGNLKYYLVWSSPLKPFTDRDSFEFSDFTLTSVNCVSGRALVYLGTNSSEARNAFCSSTNNPIRKINLIENISNDRSIVDNTKIYVLNDDDLKHYRLNSYSDNPYSDRDSFFLSDFVSSYNRPVCNTDTDGDGVPNSSDNCPSQAGPASNNGCPVSSNYDLKFDMNLSALSGDCNQNGNYCFFTNFNDAQSKRFYFYTDNNYLLIDPAIKNFGNTASSSFTIEYYLSLDKKIDNGDFKLSKTTTSGSVKPSGIGSLSETLSISDFRVNGNNPSASNYYLIIKLNVNDSDQTNNTVAIPVAVTSSSSGFVPVKTGDASQSINAEGRMINENFRKLDGNNSQKVRVYTFSGELLKTVMISNKGEKSKIISTLSSGLYIFKYEDGSFEKVFR